MACPGCRKPLTSFVRIRLVEELYGLLREFYDRHPGSRPQGYEFPVGNAERGDNKDHMRVSHGTIAMAKCFQERHNPTLQEQQAEAIGDIGVHPFEEDGEGDADVELEGPTEEEMEAHRVWMRHLADWNRLEDEHLAAEILQYNANPGPAQDLDEMDATYEP